MKTECSNCTNFQGKLVITNSLSHKPYSRVKKVENNLEKQIQSKNYNLYIEQDYSTNKINIGVSSLRPRTMSDTIVHAELPITAKSNRYIYAAKSAIEEFENNLAKKREQEYIKQQKKIKRRELYKLIGLAPLFFIEVIAESIVPNGAGKLENFINKAIKFVKKKG